MTNDVTQMKLKVYHGIENHIFIEKYFLISINLLPINE